MPTQFLSFPQQDCGHWSHSTEDLIDYASLRRRAQTCEICRIILQWIRSMYLPRREDDGVNDPAISGWPVECAARSSGRRKLVKRITRKLCSGVYFTIKFAVDAGAVTFWLTAAALAPVTYSCTIIASTITCGCCCYCCCKTGAFDKHILSPLDYINKPLRSAKEAFLHMLQGDNVIPDSPGASDARFEPDLLEKSCSTMTADGRSCWFTRHTLAQHHGNQLPGGATGIVLESVNGDDNVKCLIYCHTYRPRGPVGSMIYFCRLKPVLSVNNPTHFLSLAWGRLFVTKWSEETDRFNHASSCLRESNLALRPIPQNGVELTSDVAIDSKLPSRLVDLGEEWDSKIIKISHIRERLQSTTVKVWDTSSASSGQDIQYVALSHRWGKTESAKLTKNTHQLFQEGRPFSHMARTYRDAMVVARRLGYRYLWVDALCIVQDDPDDWLRESTRMASVYHNASCTIAAHTAHDSMDGFLDAALEPVPTVQVRSKDGRGRYISNLTLASNFQDQVSKSFLARRGWIFQERILSPRILHFVRHHIFFEDDSRIRADDLRGSGAPLLGSWGDNKWNVQDSFRGSPYWYTLVEKYSSCALTFDTDRLPAIAGLAKDFSQRNQEGRYLFGLWEKSAHLGLLWIDVDHKRADFSRSTGPDAKVLPSWSWAHWKGRISYPQTLSDSFMKSAVKVRASEQETQHSHGEFLGLVGDEESRSLGLEGLVVELHEVRATTSRKPVGSPYFDPPAAGMYSLKTSTGSFGTWVALDGKKAGAHYFPKLSCLLVCRQSVVENDPAYRGVVQHYFLLLAEIPDQPARYQRVGVGVTMVDIWEEERCLSIL